MVEKTLISTTAPPVHPLEKPGLTRRTAVRILARNSGGPKVFATLADRISILVLGLSAVFLSFWEGVHASPVCAGSSKGVWYADPPIRLSTVGLAGDGPEPMGPQIVSEAFTISPLADDPRFTVYWNSFDSAVPATTLKRSTVEFGSNSAQQGVCYVAPNSTQFSASTVLPLASFQRWDSVCLSRMKGVFCHFSSPGSCSEGEKVLASSTTGSGETFGPTILSPFADLHGNSSRWDLSQGAGLLAVWQTYTGMGRRQTHYKRLTPSYSSEVTSYDTSNEIHAAAMTAFAKARSGTTGGFFAVSSLLIEQSTQFPPELHYRLVRDNGTISGPSRLAGCPISYPNFYGTAQVAGMDFNDESTDFECPLSGSVCPAWMVVWNCCLDSSCIFEARYVVINDKGLFVRNLEGTEGPPFNFGGPPFNHVVSYPPRFSLAPMLSDIVMVWRQADNQMLWAKWGHQKKEMDSCLIPSASDGRLGDPGLLTIAAFSNKAVGIAWRTASAVEVQLFSEKRKPSSVSWAPTASPSSSPSVWPTSVPSRQPTRSPTDSPTPAPTQRPTVAPSVAPTTPMPTEKPTDPSAILGSVLGVLGLVFGGGGCVTCCVKLESTRRRNSLPRTRGGFLESMRIALWTHGDPDSRPTIASGITDRGTALVTVSPSGQKPSRHRQLARERRHARQTTARRDRQESWLGGGVQPPSQ